MPRPISLRVSDHPHLLAQWDHAGNGDLDPAVVSAGSHTRRAWVCARGHRWPATPANRVRLGTGCRLCAYTAGRLTVADVPELARDYAPENPLAAQDVTAGSKRQVRWRCPAGHETEGHPEQRRRNGCAGCNALARPRRSPPPPLHRPVAQVPALAALFDEATTGFAASTITHGSTRPVSWRCADGHRWQASPNQVFGAVQPCGVCRRRGAVALSAFAHLAQQWDAAGNELTSGDVAAGSNTIGMWQCARGHRWPASPATRTQQDTGCRSCLRRGQRTVAQSPPHAAAYAPGNPRPASDVAAQSSERVLWRCPDVATHPGWYTTPAGFRGCSACRPGRTSRQEIAVAAELALFLPVDPAVRRVAGAARLHEVDIVAPALRLILEFDGAYWHDEAQFQGRFAKDSAKSDDLRAAGWRVVRLRETPLPLTAPEDVPVPQLDVHGAVSVVLEHLRSQLQVGGLDATAVCAYRAGGALRNAQQAEQRYEALRQARRSTADRPAGTL